jgi:hypothetical protein
VVRIARACNSEIGQPLIVAVPAHPGNSKFDAMEFTN